MTRPNIVWITLDHLVYSHHKELTGYPILPTYDRLCAEGLSFTNAFSVCPLCGPARASMLTGMYPHKHGLHMNDGENGARADFEPDEQLFNTYLKRAGYRTGYFGKWHAGEVRVAQDYGFEGFSMPGYGHPYYSEEYKAYLNELDLPEPEVTIEWKFGDPSWSGKTVALKDFPNPYKSPYFLMESCGVLNTPVETHEAFFLTHIANKWIDDVANDTQPFFLRIDPWGPHHPFFVAKPYLNQVNPADLPEYPSFQNNLDHRPAHHRSLLEYRRKAGNSNRWEDWQFLLARCHEHATQVDAAVGRVIDFLKESGLLENTLIIYTTDHCGALGSNGGEFDKGWLMVDETVRIPMAMRWQDRIEPGVTTDKFVTNMDLVPTVLEAGNAEIPTTMDGKSMADLIQNPDQTSWREEVMLQHHGHYGESHLQRQLRYKNYKYVAHLNDKEELYDIVQDPYELENLVELSHAKDILTDMRNRLRHQMMLHDDHSSQAEALLSQIN